MPSNKRESFNQKYKLEQSINNDDLFRKTADDNSTEKHTSGAHFSDIQRKRQTYYLDDDIIEAIREMAHQTRKDKSELVRNLLRNSILNEYIK